MNAKLTAVLLILAAVLANVAFTALGTSFNYPDVLDEPAGEVLAAFRDNQRRQRLVRDSGAVRRPDGADRDRRRPPLFEPSDADRRAGRDRGRRRAGHRHGFAAVILVRERRTVTA